MPQLPDESRLEFFDGGGPQCALRVLPKTGQKCLIALCIVDVHEVTPEWHLGRSEQHGLFDRPQGIVEVVDLYKISLELMSGRRNSFDHARDVLLIDGPFEECAGFSVERDTTHQLESALTKFNRLFFSGGVCFHRESAKLSPVRTRVNQLITRTAVCFRQILSSDCLTRTRNVVKERLLGNGGDLHRLGPQCALNLVSRLGSIIVQGQVGEDRTYGIGCSLGRRFNLKRPEYVHTQFAGSNFGRRLGRDIRSWLRRFCGPWRGSGSLSIRGRVEHRNVLHSTMLPSPNTPEDQTKEEQRENREKLIQRGNGRGIRRGKRCKALGMAHGRCRKFAWKRDSERNGSTDAKCGCRLTNETVELSSRGGGWPNQNCSGPRIARDQKPVGGVEESVVGCAVGIVRLAHWIGLMSGVPSTGAAPEGNGGRCQGSHRGKEMAPIGLPVIELHRAGACAERQVYESFRCETLGSDGVGGREFRARYVDRRGQGYTVGGIGYSKPEFLTDLLNRESLGYGRVRRRIQRRKHSYRHNHASTPKAKGRVPWK